eukprot:TRINITY_DN12020_c0_g1_i1.p4 TRINITY_DN12020_c0_g1~~TRINITY_DN12020_c0_g1_i1.p4  ORF type:complete len:108 (+),score=0.84 TRINITY_DN12020_c0_g1_i1:234-557(+)
MSQLLFLVLKNFPSLIRQVQYPLQNVFIQYYNFPTSPSMNTLFSIDSEKCPIVPPGTNFPNIPSGNGLDTYNNASGDLIPIEIAWSIQYKPILPKMRQGGEEIRRPD